MHHLQKLAALTAAILTLGMADGRAAEPNGTWSTEGGLSRVRIGACGDALCGTIVSLKEPNDPETGKPKLDKNNADAGKRSRPLIGVPIVLSMKKSGADKWQGQVYNATDGKTYSGSLTLTGGDSLKLEGCALGGLVCKAQAWTRTN
ncbi:MAG: hypothetical protein JWN71_3875 [Xanthobacteraceae bacterium]|nr:hypothetical protein [Xanthobacteraceae bacterium]